MGVEGPNDFVTIVNRFPIDYQRFTSLAKIHLSPQSSGVSSGI